MAVRSVVGRHDGRGVPPRGAGYSGHMVLRLKKINWLRVLLFVRTTCLRPLQRSVGEVRHQELLSAGEQILFWKSINPDSSPILPPLEVGYFLQIQMVPLRMCILCNKRDVELTTKQDPLELRPSSFFQVCRQKNSWPFRFWIELHLSYTMLETFVSELFLRNVVTPFCIGAVPGSGFRVSGFTGFVREMKALAPPFIGLCAWQGAIPLTINGPTRRTRRFAIKHLLGFLYWIPASSAT